MTKQLRKRIYGPEIWIADNTVLSFLTCKIESVSTIPFRKYIGFLTTNGSGETTFIICRRYSQVYYENNNVIC